VTEKAKRCLVLGGSGSIGAAICRRLASGGAQVGLTYFSGEARARALNAELPGSWVERCDFNDPDSIRFAIGALAERLGGLDALICAVGTPGPRFALKLGELEAADIDACVDVNARGVLLACKAALPALKAAGSASVVILGSMDGVKAVPSPIHFSTSKSALKGLVESMAHELGCQGVKVNLLAPGIVEGGASAHLSEELKKEYLKHCSMKRFARPSEIAEVAAWFALQNTYVTGQSILLNGGL
jgi:NAD(P)-dependent dehydrogenase (short-subunit alcohol dehydrogenase family)